MKISIGQALLEHLDSWSKFTLKQKAVESHYLSNFGFSNEEMDPKIEIFVKIGQDSSFLKILTLGQNLCKSQLYGIWTVFTISKLRMKKRVPKLECTRKIEWDRSILKILTFWSRSKVHLVKVFSLSLFFF